MDACYWLTEDVSLCAVTNRYCRHNLLCQANLAERLQVVNRADRRIRVFFHNVLR